MHHFDPGTGTIDVTCGNLSSAWATNTTSTMLDISAKGAVRNKENFSRNHYQLLKDADLDAFRNLVEQWTLDYAEQYAASVGA